MIQKNKNNTTQQPLEPPISLLAQTISTTRQAPTPTVGPFRPIRPYGPKFLRSASPS